MTQDSYDRFMEIQAQRNAALTNAAHRRAYQRTARGAAMMEKTGGTCERCGLSACSPMCCYYPRFRLAIAGVEVQP